MFRRLARAADRVPLPAWLAAPPQRARAAVVGLLLVCSGNMYVLRDVAHLWHPSRELLWDPQAYSERLSAVRDVLPPDARIGYVNPSLQDELSQRQDLFATRYALIPMCVVPGADQTIVLIQSDRPTPVDRTGTVVSEDPQHRWRLIRRIAPP